MPKEIKILEAASENGAGVRGASLGPKALLLEARQQNSRVFENRIWEEIPNFNHLYTPDFNTPYAKNIENIYDTLKIHTQKIGEVLADGYFPLILSGDHSNALGTISGIVDHFANDKLGVIWIDAHFDLHTPFTTPSGNLHGMVLGAALGEDNFEYQVNNPAKRTEDLWEKLKKLGAKKIEPKLLPRNLVFIGNRDFEKQELAIVDDYNILNFPPDRIEDLGIDLVLEKALEYLSDCENIYISFDVDSQDPSVSRGTGTPVKDGLTVQQSTQVFKKLFNHPKVVAFEITEINPLLDKGNLMSKSVLKMLESVLEP